MKCLTVISPGGGGSGYSGDICLGCIAKILTRGSEL